VTCQTMHYVIDRAACFSLAGLSDRRRSMIVLADAYRSHAESTCHGIMGKKLRTRLHAALLPSALPLHKAVTTH
jgi:hypothetical protein